jgi:uncharacterized protein YndB with AHSA1/START domain
MTYDTQASIPTRTESLDTPIWGDIEASDQVFPPLQLQPARTILRDRWERLVSSVVIPRPIEEVWNALTTPERIANWFGVCHGSLGSAGQEVYLDFEDGEFFHFHTTIADPPHTLVYMTRWMGVGQATVVTWKLESAGPNTVVTVTEEAKNAPWDWQTWNGGGWPGILDNLANYLRTGTSWRWVWRRMGPYAQIELPLSIFGAWDQLMAPLATKYWLLNMGGVVQAGETVPIAMGDASGIVKLSIKEIVQPGERAPSFLPSMSYSLSRPSWGAEVLGRLWIEPAGWGKSLLQVFHYNWEALPGELQLSERRILAAFWADTVKRAKQYIFMPKEPRAPHNW